MLQVKARGAFLALALALASWPAAAQVGGQDSLPDPIPPPLPRPEPPADAPKYEAIVAEAPEEAWGLPPEMLRAVQLTATVYEDYAKRFVCDEEARHAEYGGDGQVSKEKVEHYGYLLQRGPVGEPVVESRQVQAKDGTYKGEVVDAEPFPPAYFWVFLFSEFYEPYFDFRLVDERFHGFDRIYEIHFRGSLPFTDGRDIRQWEGRILVDAVYYTPIELDAEPVGQKERLDALYNLWAQSFNLMGFRTGQKPLGYTAHLRFGFRKGDLRFPTALRYDTQRVVGPGQIAMDSASTRTYSNYSFTGVAVEPRIGHVRAEPPAAPAP